MDRRLLAFGFVLLAITAVLPAQTLRLAPVEDAHTDSSNPAANYGGAPELSFGKDRSAAGAAFFRRGHVRFDLSGLPGRVPLRATFHWYQLRSSAAGCLDVSLHRVLAAWSEAGVTWASQPAHDVASVSTACVGNSFDNGWKTFDVTSLVRDWAAGVHANHGFVVRDVRESSAGASRPGFGASRESANQSLRPFLEIEFAELFGQQCSQRALFPRIGFGGGRAAPGDTFLLRTDWVMPGSMPLVVFGTSRTNWAGRPLPLSLAFVGFGGCFLNVSPDLAAAFPTLAAAPWDLSVPLPNDANLVGQTLFAQTAFQTPVSGFEASEGLGILIGR